VPAAIAGIVKFVMSMFLSGVSILSSYWFEPLSEMYS
jgi:hypothetical protein